MLLAVIFEHTRRLAAGWLALGLAAADTQTRPAADPVMIEVARQPGVGVTAGVTNRYSRPLNALLLKVTFRDESGRWQRERYRYLDAAVNFRSDEPIAAGARREFPLVSAQDYKASWSYEVQLECAMFSDGLAVGEPKGCEILRERRRAALEEIMAWEPRVASLPTAASDHSELLRSVRERMERLKQQRPESPIQGPAQAARIQVLAQLEAALGTLDERCTGRCREAVLAALEAHWRGWRAALNEAVAQPAR